MNKKILIVGLNYKTAPVEVREKFALTAFDAEQIAQSFPLKKELFECIVLSTCNRVELIAVCKEEQAAQSLLESWASACSCSIDELVPYTYTYFDEQAVNHLFQVAASLDSMVIGEPQILGQLKDAYRMAVESHRVEAVLNRLLHKSFSVAKRIRTETAIASSAVSISYAAVELAKRIFENMSEVKVLLVGAGEMAELAATHLVNAGINSIAVSNRTHERAIQLAEHFQGQVIAFEELTAHLPSIDIIISSTGAPDVIVEASDVQQTLKMRKNKPMFFIDIAVPRDIDPKINDLDNVYLYDIDDLKEVVEENMASRKDEAKKAHKIVHYESKRFMHWLEQLALQPTIVSLKEHHEELILREVEKTIRQLPSLSKDVHEALFIMSHAIAKKITHAPISFLKNYQNEVELLEEKIATVRTVFNLDGEFTTRKCPYQKRKNNLNK